VLATAWFKSEVKRARESVCYAPCCSARLAASDYLERLTVCVFWGAERIGFFSSTASAWGLGGALESDGIAPSSFPIVPGFLGLLEALHFLSPSGGQTEL